MEGGHIVKPEVGSRAHCQPCEPQATTSPFCMGCWELFSSSLYNPSLIASKSLDFKTGSSPTWVAVLAGSFPSRQLLLQTKKEADVLQRARRHSSWSSGAGDNMYNGTGQGTQVEDSMAGLRHGPARLYKAHLELIKRVWRTTWLALRTVHVPGIEATIFYLGTISQWP